MSTPALTEVRVRVLRVLFNADQPLWSMDVSRSTGIAHSTVYGTFRILYDAGWAVGVTEDNTGKGRPSRVLYRLTKEGRAQSAALLGERKN